ncbi:hypothetical protein CLOP_g11414 [Closterium sp. NIES-67]|nr:hypothetical protein CLOP_g11414 [Closterium sp. NIES-67]
MASQAATLMGSTLPALRLAAAPPASSARVAASPARAALSTKVLESKSLGELRQLAKERGMRGDTKAELVKLLASSYAAGNGAAAAKAPVAANPQLKKQLEAMPMAQLRAQARTKGVYGGSRAELVAGLLAAGAAPAAATPSAPAYLNGGVSSAPAAAAPVAAVAASSELARQLQTKPLAVLRALARQKGLRGNTKEELVAALVSASPSAAAAAPAALSSMPAASPAAAAPASSAAPAAPAAVNVSAQALARQLQTRPLSALRAMANAKGISGAAAPKDQLIRALVAAATTTAATVTEVKAAASVRASELQSKPLSELRTIARARGIRGDTKAELVKLLTAEDVVLPPLQSASMSLPFQSDLPAGGTTAIQPVQAALVATQSAAMSEAMELLLGRAEGVAEGSVAEQAAFLRNVLVAGIGIAALPLLLPVQMSTTVVATAPSATAPVVVPPPPAEPAPEVRELSAEEFCASLPASLLSPQAAKFCQAVKDIGL